VRFVGSRPGVSLVSSACWHRRAGLRRLRWREVSSVHDCLVPLLPGESKRVDLTRSIGQSRASGWLADRQATGRKRKGERRHSGQEAGRVEVSVPQSGSFVYWL